MEGKKGKVVPVHSMETCEGNRGHSSTHYEIWLYMIVSGHHSQGTLTLGKKPSTHWVGMRAKLDVMKMRKICCPAKI
jgi:hypothetical protein